MTGKKYNVILCDPPWRYDDASMHRGGALRHYPTMRTRDIARLNVQGIAARDCVLFLWVTDPFIARGVHIHIAERWGFQLKTKAFTWVKTTAPLPEARKDIGPCDEWSGGTDSKGYGKRAWNGKTAASHRVAWEISNGLIPDGLCVLHKCDNPLCVRVDHLFLGTQSDNMRDMVSKGRNHGKAPRGETHPGAKLTAAVVAEIRRRVAEGETQASMTRAFGVSKQTISGVVLGKSWVTMDTQMPGGMNLAVGMGHWTRSNPEVCWLGIRGNPKRASAAVHSVVMAPRGKHSAKPPEVRDRIVELCGDVPRIELFARGKVPEGWDSWGNEADETRDP